MTERELEDNAMLVRSNGDAKLLDRICDHTESYREGLGGGPERLRGGLRTPRTAGIARLVALRLVRYQRGHAIATAYGFSVSTRLIVMKAQRR